MNTDVNAQVGSSNVKPTSQARSSLKLLYIEQIKDTATELSELMTEYGVSVRAISEDSLVRLAALDEDKVRTINTNLQSYAHVCTTAKRNKVDLKDTKAFVSAALKHFGLRTSASFYDTVASDDLVEVYDTSNRQIFRNFRFYEISKYALCDLITFEWHELYYRPSTATEAIFGSVGEIMASDADKLQMKVPTHLMKEIKAEPVHVFQVDFKYIAPTLNDDGQKAGFVLNIQGKDLPELETLPLDFI